MVFGHVSIILPAMPRAAVPFSRAFHAPLAVSHSGLVLRIPGDLPIWEPGRLGGGMTWPFSASTVATAALTRRKPAGAPGHAGRGGPWDSASTDTVAVGDDV